jgi:hypothetical protein
LPLLPLINASKITGNDVMTQKQKPADEQQPPKRELTPEAVRALAEASERRRQAEIERAQSPTEVGGRAGPDPVRYGDWEKGGIASDF